MIEPSECDCQENINKNPPPPEADFFFCNKCGAFYFPKYCEKEE